jgi:dihydrolipoamide dehydrogenase
MAEIELLVPDLGNFSDVAVVDVLVRAGDAVELDTPLITLETDKATLDVPATAAGTVLSVLVRKGDTVSKGSVIARLALEGDTATTTASTSTPGDTMPMPALSLDDGGQARVSRAQPGERSAALLVIGAGPGGYTAAFRAADLGLSVTLVDRWPMLGGVCLNVGCIPSKALLHAARVIEDAQAMGAHGIDFGPPRIDTAKLRGWKSGVVQRLTGGLKTLAKQRKVEVLQGSARFIGPHHVELVHEGVTERLHFEQCIIAAGSESLKLPFAPRDPRVMDSTGALELADIPARLLVIGGGIIGLEMACVYDALGSRVSVVELSPGLMPGCDPDLVRPLEKIIRARYERILVRTRVTAIEAKPDGIAVSFSGPEAPARELYDRVLVAVGRVPNGRALGLEAAGVTVNERGFVPVDRQMRSNQPHIFAIGDLAGPPMLAHKATHEAKVAAEVAAGEKRAFDARTVPSVAYTDPEIAWAGLTEIEAKAKDIPYRKGVFPWMASGRSLALGREEGITKLLFDPQNGRVLGAGIVGPGAGELIGEVALAIEMGADAHDIGLTIHPHPTLSETVAFAAEAFSGTLTDLYLPRKA